MTTQHPTTPTGADLTDRAVRPGDTPHRVTGHVTDQLSDAAHHVLAEVKPKLRGWLHAATAPLTLTAGIVLIALSPPGTVRFGSVVFTLTALLLFTVSATMHRGRWSRRTGLLLRRLDHASIFLLIAGSYTPFSLLLLEGSDRTALLALAWSGALLGIAFRLLWTDAPRWLYTPVYIALGWAAVFFFPQFAANGSAAVVALLAAGGILYTLGGAVYGFQRPNPFPSWFGFHEVFHTLTILAFFAHYAGVFLATDALR
jgi:hemolysin III